VRLHGAPAIAGARRLESDDPAFPISAGAVAIVDALRILLSNPAVWEKTVLIVTYDENGGFFDHVTPPTAPIGTPGEWVPNSIDINNVAGSGGIRGPIGLGFRVPCFVTSPYSRGPLKVSDIFDHTSQLKLVSRRFSVPVPNISAWRNGVVGDMTTAFNFSVAPNSSRPNLDHPVLAAIPKFPQCIPNVILGSSVKTSIPYRVPYPQTMPTQESGPARGELPAVSAESMSAGGRESGGHSAQNLAPVGTRNFPRHAVNGWL
jgi:phospholipase C